MYLKTTLLRNYGNFQLDMDKIGRYSTSKHEIHLPYTGPLPAELSDATNATISITLQVGLAINLLLIVDQNGKKHRCLIQATPEKINGILWSFFFTEDGHTRYDTGLSRYNLGFWQGHYINWQRIVLEERVLDHIRHSKTA